MSFEWHGEHIYRLKQLVAEKLSASQIAARLGEGLTRSAVIGKLHRLGLATGNKRPEVTAQERELSARAKALRAEGHSHEAIAQRIGKHREWVRVRTIGIAATVAFVEPRRGPVAAPMAQPAPKPALLLDEPIAPAPASNPVDIMGLTSTTCRWPLWSLSERGGLYCGAGCDHDHPYCCHHTNLATRDWNAPLPPEPSDDAAGRRAASTIILDEEAA